MDNFGLNVRTLGEPSLPAVLLLHGFLGDISDWDQLATGLSGSFHVIMVDLPGHGESVGLPTEQYEIGACSHLLCKVLDELHVERCSVVGYSMGGRVALQFAVLTPERVDRLVLESTTAGLRREDERNERIAADELKAVRLETESLEQFLSAWYQQPVFASIASRPELCDALVKKRGEGNGRELAKSLRQMGTGRMLPLWDSLPQFPVPTLCMAGELDPKFAALAREMAVATPNCRAQVVSEAGHIVHLEQPGEFLYRVREFLSR